MQAAETLKGIARYNDTVGIFHKETDRAAAVLAGSYLEVLLEEVLRSRFVKGSAVDELFKGQGALATFSARASLSYALGILDEVTFRDMTLIRKIRNHFAHHIADASFDEPAVRSRCAELSLMKVPPPQAQKDERPQEPRIQFLLSVGLITLFLLREAFEQPDADGKPQPPGAPQPP